MWAFRLRWSSSLSRTPSAHVGVARSQRDGPELVSLPAKESALAGLVPFNDSSLQTADKTHTNDGQKYYPSSLKTLSI